MYRKLFFVLFILFTIRVSAQDTLGTRTFNGHSPKKAVLLSAGLPGLGQCYNKKYWKVPIIYGAAIGLVYSAQFANSNYQQYLADYKIKSNPDTNISKQYQGPYSATNLILIKDFYRRNRDLSVIGIFVLYGLNIIDAYVDAQLFNFDVGDNLSLKFSPYIAPNYVGLGLNINLKKKYN